jgi:quinol monooxygenase YgiN
LDELSPFDIYNSLRFIFHVLYFIDTQEPYPYTSTAKYKKGDKIMITLIATLKVKEGKIQEAINALKEIVPKIKASEPGCLEYIPHTVRGDENTIIIYEKYSDKDALKLHSANLMKNMEKLFPLLEPGMDVKTCYEIIQ